MEKQLPEAKSVAKRRSLKFLITLAVLAGAIAALYFYLFNPPKPWIVRWQVGRYLANKTGSKNFKVEFPFPSKAEMAKVLPKTDGKTLAKGPKTGKDFDTLKAEYIKIKTTILNSENQLQEFKRDQAFRQTQLEAFTKQLAEAIAASETNLTTLQTRISDTTQRLAKAEQEMASLTDQVKQNPAREEALVPIVADLWEFQRLWAAEQKAIDASPENALAKGRAQLAANVRKELDSAKTWASIYLPIAQELYVAGRLLESANVEHQRIGLGLVLQAIQHALDDAQDYYLAGRICEGYIWPHLDAAEENRRSQLSLENLINTCANTFRQNAEYDMVVRNYELLLNQSSTPQRTDWARSQLAFAHEAAGDYKQALANLRAIQATNDYRWAMRMIPRLEERVKFNQNR